MVKGYAQKLSEEVAAVEPPHTWYFTHFVVFNPTMSGKLRFVLDAAAIAGAVSLNDALLPGPNLLNSLIHVRAQYVSGPMVTNEVFRFLLSVFLMIAHTAVMLRDYSS